MENDFCKILNTRLSGLMPDVFIGTHHIHIVVRAGSLGFSDGKNHHTATTAHLVVWQMSNAIEKISYSSDFEADFLIVSADFLQHYNPEMVWASKGFVFIRLNPAFHLDADSLALIDNDWEQFRRRQSTPGEQFRRELLGHQLQLFLYDLWTVYWQGMAHMEASDSSGRLFLRLLSLLGQHTRTEREVSYYASRLCVTPKYLSQVSKSVSGLPVSAWITFYATYELVGLLGDSSLTLTEVADKMNFSTMSFLSRYVKKTLGVTPSQYRQKNDYFSNL